MTMDSRRRGLRLIRAAVAGVVAFLVAAGAWIAVQAARNPDVRARRPRWLDADVAYDVGYWVPLLVTVVVGALLVLAVLVRAGRRLRAGEDLFRQNRSRSRTLATGQAAPPGQELDELLAGVTDENLHAEIDAGARRGNETA